ncbi:NADH:flavin oxidoreductase [Sphingomonas sp.]|uniref:NADH:flavin oxidoreductase n=1 Tax=Sphingomonas sp. TaxID=28214 RepID=UPI003AFFAC47
MTDLDSLFTPFSLKSLNMRNRIVMSPMGRSSAPGGVPIEAAVPYYGRRAEGGAGLVISEASGIARPAASNDPDAPDFHGTALERWKEVLAAVHAGGAAMAPQLWHVGAMADFRYPDLPRPFESPSGRVTAQMPNGGQMTDADIADTIAAYADGARAAKQMGFDMVELHAGHGYLIDQFFWSATNLREDQYNGSIRERTRFAVEILQAVREAVGPDFAISLRISQWKTLEFAARLAHTPDELAHWVEPLADAGADIFHCSQRRFWEPEFEGSELNFAGWVKKLSGRPTITVGSVSLDSDFVNSTFEGQPASPVSIENLVERLDRAEFDLVAVGRAMIANPDWAEKVRTGRTDTLKSFSPAMLATLD